jgi:hypothetical protein
MVDAFKFPRKYSADQFEDLFPALEINRRELESYLSFDLATRFADATHSHSAYSETDHTHTEDDITDLGSYLTSSKTLIPITFSKAGELETGTGTFRWYAPWAGTIKTVRSSVGTAPTGAALIVDVNKNGTTIFTTQADRPEIAVSGNYSGEETPAVDSLSEGNYLTVDIDQVGSTVAGEDLVVVIEIEVTDV